MAHRTRGAAAVCHASSTVTSTSSCRRAFCSLSRRVFFFFAGCRRICVVSRAFLAGGCTYASKPRSMVKQQEWPAELSIRFSKIRRRPRRESDGSCRSSGVYSHFLGQDGATFQWASRRAAGECLRELMSRRFPCHARALGALCLDLEWLTNWLSFFVGVAVSVAGR